VWELKFIIGLATLIEHSCWSIFIYLCCWYLLDFFFCSQNLILKGFGKLKKKKKKKKNPCSFHLRLRLHSSLPHNHTSTPACTGHRVARVRLATALVELETDHFCFPTRRSTPPAYSACTSTRNRSKKGHLILHAACWWPEWRSAQKTPQGELSSPAVISHQQHNVRPGKASWPPEPDDEHSSSRFLCAFRRAPAKWPDLLVPNDECRVHRMIILPSTWVPRLHALSPSPAPCIKAGINHHQACTVRRPNGGCSLVLRQSSLV